MQQEQQIQQRQDQLDEQGRVLQESRREVERRDQDIKDMQN
jgi:hypothetical protein